MKLRYILPLGALAMLVASCELKDELIGGGSNSADAGHLELGISVRQPVSQTRADGDDIDTSTFPVTISGESLDAPLEYATAADMPASIRLAVGNYTVSAHSPGELVKQMTAPYYAATRDFTITKDITSEVNVVCTMANSRIQMVYGEDFLAAFSAWTITVDDGSDKVLTYTQADLNPAAVYWYFEEGQTTTVRVNITATTKEGNTVTDSRAFKKEDAEAQYEEEGEYFTGGDALVFNMGTVASASGDVNGITIRTEITFEDEEEAVEIPAFGDNDPGQGGTDEPGTGSDFITISEPEGNSYLTDGATISGGVSPDPAIKIDMAVEKGIQNLYVRIDTDNATFDGLVTGMGLTSEQGLDLANLSEDNAALANLFPLPTVGNTIYSFTLSEYLAKDLLGNYEGVHSFIFTIVDQEGNRASATLTVTVIK